MDLSSLVLVAILGVWVAYLVPYWLRRRSDLAESRTPDRFSGGLRVLQRRSRGRGATGNGHRSGDAVLTSPRVVVDADGEYLYIPADRALEARLAASSPDPLAEPVAAAPVNEPIEDDEQKDDGPKDDESRDAVSPVDENPVDENPVDEIQVDAGVRIDAAVPVEIVVPEPSMNASSRPTPTRRPSPAPEPVADADHEADAPGERGPVSSSPDAVPDQPVAAPAPTPVAAARPAVTRPAATRPAATRPAVTRPSEPVTAEGPSDLEIAIDLARTAARRRARIMALLFLATSGSWLAGLLGAVPVWAAAPASALLVLHVLASRAAGLRSRASLMALAVQVQSAELIRARPQVDVTRPPVVETPAPGAVDRAARRAAAVGAETWEPVPVPPPTYTLKPAVHRPEPAPLDLPDAAPATAPAAASAVSRGALPRRPADVERILALESHLDELFEEPKVVNG